MREEDTNGEHERGSLHRRKARTKDEDKSPGINAQDTLELGIHVPVHFDDFAARGRVDKVVPDDVRLREVVTRVPDLAQELIEPGVHAPRGCRVFQDVAAGSCQ